MDLKTLSIIMFQDKRHWNEVTDADKESLFFIFNRYMAKGYPKQAQMFNTKGVDKMTAMDVWFQFLRSQVRTPKWFWPGPTKKKDPGIKGWQVLQEFDTSIRTEDIYILAELFPKELKEEIKRLELIKTEQEK